MRVLIAQSDVDYAKKLEACLKECSYIVDVASDAASASTLTDTHDHEVLLVDRMLPEDGGVAFCRQLRRSGVATPIIMVGKPDETQPAVDALDAGADDYVARSIDAEELQARIRAMLRRGVAEEGAEVSYGGIEIDLANRVVNVEGTPLVLTPRELALLEFLLRNRERVVSRNAMGDRVWGLEYGEENSNVVDVYISRLRRKLKDAGKPFIRTIHGTGYMLAASTCSTESDQQSNA